MLRVISWIVSLFRQPASGLKVITPGLDNRVGDATPSSDGVKSRMAGEPAYCSEKGAGLIAVCQRGHDLPGRVLHAIRGIAGVDARDVNRCGIIFATGRDQFLRPQERALQSVNV